jgi:hypothetical protein
MRRRAIHVNGRPLGKVRHICAFFHSKEDEYRALLDFIKEGIERNEKAFHIVDAQQRDSHRCRLQQEGIDIAESEKTGQLKVACWEDAYLKDGYFDQNRQINLLESILIAGKAEGFALTRLVANMEWALEAKAGVNDIVEYEARLNYLLPKYPDPVICTYDLSRFNAGVAMDILRTHPMVILGGVLQQNPLYIPPDAFLEELAGRRATMA